ncbi:MAG: MFS transporter, partial [Nocardioidaceae bacterium]
MTDTTPHGTGAVGIADLSPLARRKEQRAWYWYDWANSAYVTTVTTVLFAPYLIAIAKEAAVDNRVQLLGFIPVAPGALPSYIITFSTILSAVLLPLLGAVADRVENKKGLLAGFAWTGAAFAALLFFCSGGNWQIGAVAVIGANLCLGASTVFNDSMLPLISTEDERDR